MAKKRMFSLSVVDTDRFLEMPISSRLLYYELGMRADDDGFVDNWKKILLFTGLKEDDMKVLISKQFLIPFESGVIVIRHWRMNNYLQNDRTNPTIHQEEKSYLTLDKNNVYNLDTNCIHSIDKNSIDKINIKEESKEEKALSFTESTTLSKREYFKKPTLEEVQDYIQERNCSVDANTFYDFYESKNWYVGKNKMKDWKACIRTWEQRNPKQKAPEWLNKDIEVEEITDKETEELEKIMKEFK